MPATHSKQHRLTAVTAVLFCNLSMALAFSNPSLHTSFGVPLASFHSRSVNNKRKPNVHAKSCAPLFLSSESKFEKINEEDDQVMAFMDTTGDRGIDCYVDSYATLDGEEFTIGSPCDYAVALCYFEGEEQLVPIELDDPLMDDVFPIAEGIIEDEFGEELVLLRTPQTLTLVGELEEDEDMDDDDLASSVDDAEEEVEILVSFEEDGREYHLVRLLDPVLLVGKVGDENTRILLTPEESDIVMPKLEAMFMSHSEEGDEN